jgi:tetratricopeptide (TPR) repeat protein/predicted aspartyl protease
MTRISAVLSSAAALLTTIAGFHAQAACSFKKLAELPVTMLGLRPMVPGRINGVEVQMLADSGAFISSITRSAAMKAKVPLRGVAKGVQGASGQAAMDVGVVDSFELSGLSLGSLTFLVGADVMGGESSGLLGQNILGRLDVEYDLANGVIRLFSADGCDDAYLAYWTGDQRAGMLTMAPRSRTRPHIIVPASVNGQPIRALLDTGASTSVLKLTAAGRAGVKTNSDGVKAAGMSMGISGRGLDTWLAPVSSFAFGDEQIQNTRLRISSVELGEADMLIGADFFLSHRIFVSNSQNRIYFTYNGGPVFRLDGQAPAAVATAPAETPTDAAAYDRRAAASAARRDYASALADYSKAIEMEPKAPAHRYARSKLHEAMGKPDLAIADLDETLKLAPDDMATRMRRARLRLSAKDLPGAEADLDATLKSQPETSDQVMEVARLLHDHGYYREALPYYDRWIASHPDDKGLSSALNFRCWDRAVWGQDLNLALADCEASLRLARRNPAALDSRGLVRLKMGQVDAALDDYDASLRMDPTAARTRYARGLARHRKGLKAEGDKDIAVALKLEPDMPDLAKRYGLEAP